MNAAAAIRRKRDGEALDAAQLAAFARGLADGRVSDAEAGAFAMAVFLRGMTDEETVALTRAMRDSGAVLDWSDLPGPTVDKHSTGGIGDKTSLVLAPLLAASGAYVPMLSGRALGHTGGTIDKLESFAGYDASPDPARLRRVLREAGCAIVGAGPAIAPADRRLYAVRDRTATVESLPLIVASILSKKLAGGARSLVLDVKCGAAAFMTTEAAASALAASLVAVAEGAGMGAEALVTRMDGVLGRTVGHALEVREAMAMLRGEAVSADLQSVTMALAEKMARLAGLDVDLEARLADGSAFERFERMVVGLGGVFALPPEAPVIVPLPSPRSGVVARVEGRTLGLALSMLGGEVGIDHAVGFADVAAVGDRVRAGDPLCLIHAREQAAGAAAIATLAGVFVVEDEIPVARSLIVRDGRR